MFHLLRSSCTRRFIHSGGLIKTSGSKCLTFQKLKSNLATLTTKRYNSVYTVSSKKYISKSILIVGTTVFIGNCLYNFAQTQQSRDAFSAAVSANIRKAYMYLFGSVALTCAASRYLVAYAATRSPLMSLVIAYAVIFTVPHLVMSADGETLNGRIIKLAGLCAICTSLGLTFAHVLPHISPHIIKQASLTAATLFGGLCIAGSVAPTGKFDDMAGVLSVGLLVVIAASIANIFAPPHVKLFNKMVTYMGIPVISGLTLISSNALVDDATTSVATGRYFDPVSSIIPMLYQFINLFSIFLNSNNRRK